MPEVSSGRRSVTLVDVAQEANVHYSTASRILNRDDSLRVSAATRTRVQGAAKRLGYTPNLAARSLSSAVHNALGLLIPDFDNPIYGQVMRGADNEARRRGHTLVVGSTKSDVNSELDRNELLGHGRVYGLMLAGGQAQEELIRALASRQAPWLTINRRVRNLKRYALLDDYGAAYGVTKYLIEMGHTRVAFVGGPRSVDTGVRRRSGYRDALHEAGLRAYSALEWAGGYVPDTGREALASLLEARRRPTGVVCASAIQALGLIKRAHELDVDVPNELSVVGVHDIPLADYIKPALTTMKMPLERLGEEAVRLLLDRDSREEIEVMVREPMEIVVRETA